MSYYCTNHVDSKFPLGAIVPTATSWKWLGSSFVDDHRRSEIVCKINGGEWKMMNGLPVFHWFSHSIVLVLLTLTTPLDGNLQLNLQIILTLICLIYSIATFFLTETRDAQMTRDSKVFFGIKSSVYGFYVDSYAVVAVCYCLSSGTKKEKKLFHYHRVHIHHVT